MDLHLGLQTLVSILTVLAVLTLVTVAFQIVEDLDTNQSFLSVALVVLRDVPFSLYNLVPFCIFLGSLIGIGNLNATAELTIYRIAGASPLRIFLPIAIVAMTLTIAAIGLVEWVSNQQADSSQTNKAAPTQVRDIWLRTSDSILFIERANQDGDLADIVRLEKRTDGRSAISTAQHGSYSWVEDNYQIHAASTALFGKEETQISTNNDQTLKSPGFSSLFVDTSTRPEKLSLMSLNTVVRDGNTGQSNVKEHEVEYWERLYRPLVSAALAFVGMMSVMGLAREVSLGARLGGGLLFGLGFYYIEQLFGPIAIVYDLDAQFVLLTPIALALGLGYVLLKRAM